MHQQAARCHGLAFLHRQPGDDFTGGGFEDDAIAFNGTESGLVNARFTAAQEQQYQPGKGNGAGPENRARRSDSEWRVPAGSEHSVVNLFGGLLMRLSFQCLWLKGKQVRRVPKAV
ncbi:hypothetical protein GCM10027217_42240 [Pseudomaricurvus hydrocarbonicus]